MDKRKKITEGSSFTGSLGDRCRLEQGRVVLDEPTEQVDKAKDEGTSKRKEVRKMPKPSRNRVPPQKSDKLKRKGKGKKGKIL